MDDTENFYNFAFNPVRKNKRCSINNQFARVWYSSLTPACRKVCEPFDGIEYPGGCRLRRIGIILGYAGTNQTQVTAGPHRPGYSHAGGSPSFSLPHVTNHSRIRS